MVEPSAPQPKPLTPGCVVLRQPQRDSGDSKRRPCVVISNPDRCLDPAASTVIVVPLTSDTDGRQRLPMPVIPADPANGLARSSAAMCGRVSCVRKDRLSAPLGQLEPQELNRVRLGVAAVIGLGEVLLAAQAVDAQTMA